MTGESDSESPAGTPHKAPPPPRPDSWELQRLREIQLHEAAVLGYSLEATEEEVSVVSCYYKSCILLNVTHYISVNQSILMFSGNTVPLTLMVPHTVYDSQVFP